MMGRTDMLAVRGLTKRYPAFVLEDVSFTLRPGRIMGLIGKNGAGKSTTLKAILRLVAPDAGEVRILGRDFRREETACKQEMGIVLGGIDFYMYKKLAAITDVTRRFYPQWDEEAYRRYCRLFDLDESKRVNQLSSGMRVKYLIALALSHQARLLILDEPTSGLDPVARDELLALFRRVVKNGERSVLFSTHITSDLDSCADDITYLQGGRVLQSRDKAGFLRAFDHLKRPEDTGALTLAQIMIRTERGARDDDAAFIRKSGWLPIHPSSFSSVWGR
jgi:hypothetical protein